MNTRHTRSFRPTLVNSAALLLTAAAALSAGCVGYNVYPNAPGEYGFTNVNDDPFPTLATESLKWAVTRYPPNAATEYSVAAPAGPGQTAFAVNLPAGTTAPVAERIVENIGFNARSLTPGNENLPIYHVARVWVCGDDAKVDIVRPILGFPGGGPDGRQTTQGITIRLRGGMKPWTVTSHRVWSFNAMSVPALNYLPQEPGAAPPPPAKSEPEMEAAPSAAAEPSQPSSGD